MIKMLCPSLLEVRTGGNITMMSLFTELDDTFWLGLRCSNTKLKCNEITDWGCHRHRRKKQREE